ncbi:MAG: hypothetical protein IPM84_23880 [Anaerolineae bacterium]|nr:hypothetical protein [Anaerolineae bacterium]
MAIPSSAKVVTRRSVSPVAVMVASPISLPLALRTARRVPPGAARGWRTFVSSASGFASGAAVTR